MFNELLLNDETNLGDGKGDLDFGGGTSGANGKLDYYVPATPINLNSNAPPPNQPDFFTSLAKSLGTTKQNAELIVGVGAVLLLLLLVPKHH